MIDTAIQIRNLLDSLCDLCSKYPYLKNEYLLSLDRLRQKLNQPCVLAIAGRVKAGKSSFLNALLGEDLAKVGDTETTATINYFIGGKPQDPKHPIKVVWESGNETYVDKSFMDSLQGRDEETLRRAQGIKWLEYYIDNPILREITLVDTPGTDAIVGDDSNAHEDVTREYFQLRCKHSRQTDECTSNADAVIYLVGPVPTKSGLTFLSEFQSATGSSSAINSIGILSKVDVDMTLLLKRKEQAQYIADGLKDQLNTVVPVSASIYNAVRENKTRFNEWKKIMSDIPKEAFEYLMSSEECYYEDDGEVLEALYDNTKKTPVSLADRKALRGNLIWSVFRTIAYSLYQHEKTDDAILELEDVAGINNAWNILNNIFFRRAKSIRCYNVIVGLEKILYDLLHRNLRIMHDKCFLLPKAEAYISCCKDTNVRNLLHDAIQQLVLSSKNVEDIEKVIVEMQQKIETMHIQLEHDDRNFSMLHNLEKEKSLFQQDEYEELCVLFGLYEGILPQDISARQSYWNYMANCAANKNLQDIAEYAVETYGEILNKNEYEF